MVAQSQRERIMEHLWNVYGTEAEHLWARYPDYAVFRHPASRKWYAAVMDVPRDKLGLTGGGRAEILNVKCSPLMIGSLLGQRGFLPAYHMNKSTWISVLLDGSIPEGQITPLLAWSYDSAAPNPRRRKAENIP